MTEAQKCLYHIAENMRMDKSISKEGYEYFQQAIKALGEEPRRGHWIKVTNGRGGHECDVCHEYAPSYQSGDEYLTNYCPNCGVKMERSDKE